MELMVVIAIIGIMAGIALPNILAWQTNLRLKAAARDLYSNIQKAKVEAVKRNQNVVIAINKVNCSSGLPSPGGGYQIFVDDGSGGGTAGNNVKDGNEMTLANDTMPKYVAICNETFGGNTGFLPNGLVINNNIGSIILKNDQGRSYQLNMTIAGSIRLQ